MKVKKLAAVFLTGILTIGLMTGCGAGSEKQSASANDTQTSSAGSSGNEETETNSGSVTDATENSSTENEATESASTVNDTTGNGKTLVVYYSATGNTKDVAEKIAKLTGSDLFEIEPKEPYTDDDLDWTKDDSRVTREHEDESLRDVELVSTTVDNWDSYETVYIGYPVWWAVAAWPVNQFIKNNDFTGKTVIPFCTAASSGIGDSGNLLKDMAETGDWKDGERFHGGASEEDISSWIDSLGL